MRGKSNPTQKTKPRPRPPRGALRDAAQSESEIESSDESLAGTLHDSGKDAAEVRALIGKQKQPGFSERDYRLLYVLANGAQDKGSASFALAEGLKQNPKSILLSKLDASDARQSDDGARRLAALERLSEIDPQRASDWMTERVRAYREAAQWTEAIALAKQIVLAAPAKADARLLLADTELAAGRTDDAISDLREAMRLSDQPNQIRLRLADIYTSRQQFGAARDILDEAFEAEDSPSGKLQLTARLANAYMQDGKIDELISKFRGRQKAEQGWRYALYLAAIYQMLGDNANAMQELDKALAGKPDDPTLLKKLLELASANGDSEASLRYAQKLAQVEPSRENRALLGEAMVDDDKLDQALSLIRENSAEFLENPDDWQETLRALQGENKAADLASMLEAQLRSEPDDWKSRMALARILMAAGQTDRASTVYWDILGMKDQPQAAPAPTPSPATPIPGMPMRISSYGGMRVFYGGRALVAPDRQYRWNMNYQNAMQVLTQRPAEYANNRRFGSSQPSTPIDLPQAKDEAMAYLAAIALREGKDAEFLDRLRPLLKSRSALDRIVTYSLLQAPDPLVSEIKADAPTLDEKSGAIAIQSLRAVLGRSAAAKADASFSPDEINTLIGQIGDRLAASSSKEPSPVKRYQILLSIGKEDEAAKLVDQIFAETDQKDASQLITAFNLAIRYQRFDKAVELRDKLLALGQSGAKLPPGTELGLALQMLGNPGFREKGIDLVASVFDQAPAGAAPFIGFAGRQQYTWPQLRGSLSMLMPYPTPEVSLQQVGFLRGLFLQNPGLRDVLPDLAKRFDTLAKEKKSSSLAQAAIWLQWFSGKQDDALAAMKALVETKPSDELLINYAMMLAEQKKTDDALKALDQVQPASGDNYDMATRLRFAIALRVKDDKAARAAAAKLVSIQLVNYEQGQLVAELQRLGMKDDAQKLQRKLTMAASPGQQSRQMVEIMRDRADNGKRDEALTLANAILSRDPLSRSAMNQRYQQEEALRTLNKFGELKGYVEQLRRQLAEAPDSERLNAQMAMALSVGDRKLAEPYYRKLAELRPNDPTWLSQLGQILVESDQQEEAMKLYESLLAKDPAILFAQGGNFVEPFSRTKSWKRLAGALANSPDPKPDPFNMFGQNYSYVFRSIADQLQHARPPIDSTDVLMKALKWSQNNDFEIRPILAQSLMRDGRTDEARSVIEGAFFPPVRDSSSKIFVFNRQPPGNPIWNQIMSYGDGGISSPAVQMLQIANSFGFLKDLMPRLEKLPPQANGLDPGMLARIVARDESVLPEIRKSLDDAKTAQPGKAVLFQPGDFRARMIASQLFDWPKGRKLAYELLAAYLAERPGMNPDPYGRLTTLAQLATLAQEDGKSEIARKALQDWGKYLTTWQHQGGQLDIEQGLQVVRLMCYAGLDSEAEGVVQTLRTISNQANNKYYQRMLAEGENEIALSRGKGGEAEAVLTWVPGNGDGKVIWDFRPAGGADTGDKTIWLDDRPLTRLSGKYTLEVYFGEDENSMKRLFTKSNADARGSWTGKLPASRGFLRALIRRGDDVRFGPAVPVASGTALLASADLEAVANAQNGSAKGWSSIPLAQAKFVKGGPLGTGYLHLAGFHNTSSELIAERVKIDPQKNYLLGGWFRYGQNESSRIGWRLYNDAGDQVGEYGGSGNFRYGRWNLATESIGRGDHSEINNQATWLEPYVAFEGDCDVQGLSVIEIPPSEDNE